MDGLKSRIWAVPTKRPKERFDCVALHSNVEGSNLTNPPATHALGKIRLRQYSAYADESIPPADEIAAGR